MWGYGRGGGGSLSKTKAHLQVAFFHLQEFASCFSCMNACVRVRAAHLRVCMGACM